MIAFREAVSNSSTSLLLTTNPFSFTETLMQIYKRTNEGDTAEDTDIPGKLVIKKYRPIDMRVAKFLQHKHKHRPGISQKIRRYDKEPYIP